MNSKISKLINNIESELIDIRREFHQYPELGFNEKKTSMMIKKYLKSFGLEIQDSIIETGVVGILNGNKKGKTIAVRADIDALPILEETNLDFKSKNEGVMHACGHDGHITIALGTAKILSEFKDNLKGNVKFIFQPAEEKLTGAQSMINNNVLHTPEVDAIIGLHIWPDLNSGEIGIKEGPLMAAVDKFEIEIIGEGGHGAIPHKTVDPIVIAAEVVNGVQKIISREINALDSSVITIGTLQAGSAFNIIPNKVKMSGTVRTLSLKQRNFISKRMEDIISSITKGYRAEYSLDYNYRVPVTDNDEKLSTYIINILNNAFGKDNIITKVKPSMGGEDFSLYQKEVPGTYMFLGTKNKDQGITMPIHHSEYNIDESILKMGVNAFCEIILNYLS